MFLCHRCHESFPQNQDLKNHFEDNDCVLTTQQTPLLTPLNVPGHSANSTGQLPHQTATTPTPLPFLQNDDYGIVH